MILSDWRAACIEALAEIEHIRWAKWQSHVHVQSIHNEDGSLTIPRELIDRWKHLIATNFQDLSEHDKNKDRIEATESFDALHGIVWICPLEATDEMLEAGVTAEPSLWRPSGNTRARHLFAAMATIGNLTKHPPLK